MASQASYVTSGLIQDEIVEAKSLAGTGFVVGIDLGTSNSSIALWHIDKMRVKVFKSGESLRRTIPSAVFWDSHSDPQKQPDLVGQNAAEAIALRSSDNGPQSEKACGVTCGVHGVKRIIGQHWDSEALRPTLTSLPFEAVRGADGLAAVEVRCGENEENVNKSIRSAVDISAVIVRELVDAAEEYLQQKIKEKKSPGMFAFIGEHGTVIRRAVVGVPVYFTHEQREATREAVKQAGIDHVAIMAESTAAAMNYGLFVAGAKTVFVFDAGGGTTDVTILRIDDGVFETLGTAGDNSLGGLDMDLALAHFMVDKAKRHQPGTTHEPENFNALRIACRAAKEELSSESSTTVKWRTREGAEIDLAVSQDELLEAIQPLVKRTRHLVTTLLADVDIKVQDIDEVVLAGGASRTLAIRQLLQQVFMKPELCLAMDADTCVGEGLAIRGALLGGYVKEDVLKDVLMLDVLPLAIGIEDHSTTYVLENGEKSGRFQEVLPRHAKLPATASVTFRCEDPNQKGVTVELFEGTDAEVARRNTFVARFNILLPERREQQRQEDYDDDDDYDCDEDAGDAGEQADAKRNSTGDITGRRVEVVVSMSETGMISVKARDDHIDKTREGAVTDQERMLMACAIMLIFLYIMFRIFIRGSDYDIDPLSDYAHDPLLDKTTGMDSTTPEL